MDIESLILEALPEQIGRKRFDRWFGDRVHFVLRDATLYVAASDAFRADWLSENLELHIAQVCANLFGKAYPIKFVSKITDGMSLPGEQGMISLDRDGLADGYVETARSRQSAVSEMSRPVEDPIVLTGKGSRSSIMDSLRSLTGDDSVRQDSIQRPVQHSSQSLAVPSAVPVPSGLESVESEPVESKPLKASVPVAATVSQQSETQQSVPQQSSVPEQSVPQSDVPRTKTRGRDNRRVDPAYNTVSVRQPKSGSATRAAGRDHGGTGRVFETFETFVCGLSNRLARSIADIALQEPGKINPVYIYGTTSVGKTHLMEAIYSAFRVRARFGAPLFMTAEQFTTQFLQSIRKADTQSFRDRFNDISLFLLDDINFLKGKEATQQELVSMIDILKRRNVQLFFSGDRSLSELDGLRPDLVARLEGGFVCRIESPERETLLQIFQRQAAKLRLAVPDEVGRYIVSRLSSHARLLSGALKRLYAIHIATGAPITLDMAKTELVDFIQCGRRTIRLEDIEEAVLDVCGLTGSSLRNKSRTKQIAHARMLAMYLARKHTRSALSEIGRYFGNRSHSTVISAQKKIDDMLRGVSGDSADIQLPTVSQTLERIERVLNV